MKSMRVLIVAAAMSLLTVNPAMSGEWRLGGSIELESRGFFQDPLDSEQLRGLQNSIAFVPEFRYRSESEQHQFNFVPFFRIDGEDSERTHADLRQGFWRYVDDSWEFLAGLDRVYWGVTESRHLVDVINQVDGVEDVDEEDRLGQPMLAATFIQDWGTLSLYALPGFRERTFPGEEGRLRTPLVVDTDAPVYESAAEDRRLDGAVRYSHVLGDWDLGLHVFSGTNREPRLVVAGIGAELVPRYDLMNQVGLDLQYTREAWLWKLEGIGRSSNGDTFGAGVAGVEYTFFQLGGSAADLGVLGEYLQDDRDPLLSPITLFDDDYFIGARLAFNDIQDSQILAGVIVDRRLGSKFALLEIGRRLGSSFTLELEGRFFLSVDDSDVAAAFRQDDFATLRLSWNL
jgi:hypothetical protein